MLIMLIMLYSLPPHPRGGAQMKHTMEDLGGVAGRGGEGWRGGVDMGGIGKLSLRRGDGRDGAPGMGGAGNGEKRADWRA